MTGYLLLREVVGMYIKLSSPVKIDNSNKNLSVYIKKMSISIYVYQSYWKTVCISMWIWYFYWEPVSFYRSLPEKISLFEKLSVDMKDWNQPFETYVRIYEKSSRSLNSFIITGCQSMQSYSTKVFKPYKKLTSLVVT